MTFVPGPGNIMLRLFTTRGLPRVMVGDSARVVPAGFGCWVRGSRIEPRAWEGETK